MEKMPGLALGTAAAEKPHIQLEHIPETLQKAIDLQEHGIAVEPEGEPLSAESYEKLRETVLAEIAKECAENPYHARNHTEGVEQRFLRLAAEAHLTPSATQLGAIKALFHDFGHPGETIRQESDEGVERRDLSNEEYAAIRADEFLKPYLHDDQIVAVQSGILGTSFGQAEGTYARPYKPLSVSDKLLSFADVAGFTNGFDAWMKESMDVYREMPVKNLPENFDAFLARQTGFATYLESKLAEIEPFIGADTAAYYRERLREIDDGLKSEQAEKYRAEFEAIRETAKGK